jgi:hypothetical protein
LSRSKQNAASEKILCRKQKRHCDLTHLRGRQSFPIGA